MRLLALVLLAACSGTPTPTPVRPPPAPGGCDGVRAHVEALYRTEATTRDPTRVDAAVADNTAMVMGDCAATPTISGCLAGARTAADLEATCLPRLEDDGREGDSLLTLQPPLPRG